MTVKQIETPEDWSEYRADKGLHDAYSRRAEMSKTHSWQALLRKWVEHAATTSVTPSPSDGPKP